MNTFYANSVDFGVDVSELVMMKMHTATAPQGVQVALNLARKEISIKFPMSIDGVVHRFGFALPIPQLQGVYMANEEGSGQRALIIPFNHSPRFFQIGRAHV